MNLLLALAALGGSSAGDTRLAAMAALYDRVCLRAFPDDQAVEALMQTMKATELTPAEVRITMVDDPARAWQLADHSATVWIEFPPFHACSVRWSSPDFGDLKPYRAIANTYEAANGDFTPVAPYEANAGAIHIHVVGERRGLPDGATESLFVFDQQLTDPARRKAGETGFVLRFVHQFAPPEHAQ